MKLPRRIAGFTLVEVLVSAGIIVVLMGVLISMTDQTQRLMRATSSKVEQFQGARVAYETMTRRLAQATLNTFWDYRYAKNGLPQSYQRSAELRFVTGITSTLIKGGGDVKRPGTAVFFHAPYGFVEDQSQYGGLDNLVNAWGYFVEVGTDSATIPPFLNTQINPRKRYRLMEMMQPSEKLKTYDFSGGAKPDWFSSLVTANPRPVRVLAENIIALIVVPRLSRADEQLWMTQNKSKRPPVLAQEYGYDTTSTDPDPILNPKSQLPPVVQVVMVAIDEPSAKILEDKNGSDPYLGINFTTTFRNPLNLEDNPATSEPNDGELATLETLLVKKHVSYRIFSSNVSIRGAKWSRSQVN